MRNKALLFCAALLTIVPLAAGAQSQEEKNFGIIDRNIWYSQTPFFANQTITIYSAVFNSEDQEIKGEVEFFDNSKSIGTIEFEAPAGQLAQVQVDWKVASGEHTLTARIKKAYLADDPNAFVIAVNAKTAEESFDVDFDTDRDGVGDKEDQDDDGDGLTDKKEEELGTDPKNKDTDQDGLSDKEEEEKGTNPLDPDSDNDDVLDGHDANPLSARESEFVEEEKAVEEVQVVEDGGAATAKQVAKTVYEKLEDFAQKQAESLAGVRQKLKAEIEETESKVISTTKSESQTSGAEDEQQLQIKGSERGALKRAYLLFISLMYFIFKIKWLFYALLLVFIYFILKWLLRMIFKRRDDDD